MAHALNYDKQSYIESGSQLLDSYILHLDNFITTVKKTHGIPPTVLEVGAGSGVHAEYMRKQNCRVIALDPSPDSMFATQATKKFCKLTATTEQRHSFSAVHAKDVVSDHISPEEFFQIIASIIRPLGIVMICQHHGFREENLANNAMLQGFTQLSSIRWYPDKGISDWYMGTCHPRNITLYCKSS